MDTWGQNKVWLRQREVEVEVHDMDEGVILPDKVY